MGGISSAGAAHPFLLPVASDACCVMPRFSRFYSWLPGGAFSGGGRREADAARTGRVARGSILGRRVAGGVGMWRVVGGVGMRRVVPMLSAGQPGTYSLWLLLALPAGFPQFRMQFPCEYLKD